MDRNLNYKEAFMLSTLAAVSVKTDKIDFTQNSIIAITAAGVITGTYVSDEMKEALKNDLTYHTFENISIQAKEACNDASKAILFKDATLVTGQGLESRFSYLFVFIEDIIALSYGNPANN